MANVFDYLDWRGDVAFSGAPFNEIDNLILAQLCFLDLSSIVPSDPAGACVRLEDAVDRYLILHPLESTSMGFIVPETIPHMAIKAAKSRRFRDICVCAFVNRIDAAREEQFSATTYLLGDGTAYVAYRGTDDTLIGWKENFNMGFKDTIPAQADAVHYLNDVLRALPHPVRVGGHSKGGNLALYASVYADPALRERILDVYSNDGPGFSSGILHSEEYRTIKPRVHSIVPESSVVGMLLDHEENYQVVKSTAKGLFQHDGFSWQLIGDHFVTLESRSAESQYIDKTLKAWLSDMDDEHREKFVDALYTVLSATNAQTLSELNAGRKAFFASLFTIDAETRDILWKTVLQLIAAGNKIRREQNQSRKLQKAEEAAALPEAKEKAEAKKSKPAAKKDKTNGEN